MTLTALFKAENRKLTADTELASAELQCLKASQDKELADFDGQLKDLEDEIADITSQHRALRQEYQAAKRHNEDLRAKVARYQKELKERERATPVMSPLPVAKPPSPPPAPVQAPLASKAQEARGAPQSGLAPRPAPPQEDPGFWGMIKRWLLKIWHLFF